MGGRLMTTGVVTAGVVTAGAATAGVVTAGAPCGMGSPSGHIFACSHTAAELKVQAGVPSASKEAGLG